MQIRHRSALLTTSLMCALAGATLALTAEELREEIHKTYPLNADGVVAIDNVNGSIRIEAWGNAEVQLDAVKKARNKESLEALKVEIDSSTDKLKIHTKYPSSKGWWRNNSASVDYTLKVPKNARLDEVSSVNGSVNISGVENKVHASTVNGSVNARGLAGDTELSTVNGAVKAEFVNIDSVRSVSFSSVNGAVDIQLPAKANADVSLSTVNGDIRGDVEVKKNWPIGREVKTRLGEGGTKIKGSTVNGGMKITLAKN